MKVIFAALSGEEPNFEGMRNLIDDIEEKVINSSAIFYLDNTEKVHKRHLIINSNDPLIVEKFRTTEEFKTLNSEAKELDSRDDNPILKLNKKYVRVWNKLRSYPPAKREWTESDFADFEEYINLLEKTIRNLTQQ